MLALRDDGLLAQAVGVSNYSLDLIDTLTTATGERPAINQVPCSHAKYDPGMTRGLQARDVVMQGYSPLRHTDLTAAEPIGPAERLGATRPRSSSPGSSPTASPCCRPPSNPTTSVTT